MSVLSVLQQIEAAATKDMTANDAILYVLQYVQSKFQDTCLYSPKAGKNLDLEELREDLVSKIKANEDPFEHAYLFIAKAADNEATKVTKGYFHLRIHSMTRYSLVFTYDISASHITKEHESYGIQIEMLGNGPFTAYCYPLKNLSRTRIKSASQSPKIGYMMLINAISTIDEMMAKRK